MKQKERDLLLKDLCARLPYGVICTDNRHGDSRVFYIDIEDESVYYTDFDEYGLIENCKPYLRPMSSMTEEEIETYRIIIKSLLKNSVTDNVATLYNFLNSKHLDYNGLIPKGLALEAPEGMYN